MTTVDVQYQGPTYNLILGGRKVADHEFADYISSVICYNQGELAQYSFLAAEFHKAMKTAYSEGNLDTAVECRSALIDYLNRNIERITNKNFELYRAHFKRRAKMPPRICVKAAYDIESQENIVSLFRDGKVNYNSNCQTEENTGFKYIRDTGRPFLCNDIPEKAKVGEYVNPRLNIDSAKLYNSPGKMKRMLGLGKGQDDQWEKCWTTSDGKSVTSDSCYKSTLIVPMTLWNNSLDNYYKECINLEDVERTIFGFLCADHIDFDYFIPDIDVSVGYVFADLLSLYLISRMVYTEISDTYRSVSEAL